MPENVCHETSNYPNLFTQTHQHTETLLKWSLVTSYEMNISKIQIKAQMNHQDIVLLTRRPTKW